MLYFGYFSHWDTQGYKPYMRYTLLGGNGSLDENIDSQGGPCPPGYSCPWEFTSLITVKQAIAKGESVMVYNDSVCCGDGHRRAILDPANTQVSLGISYNATDFFLVEDFVDSHASFTTLSFNPISLNVSMSGSSLSKLNATGGQVAIRYDPTPVFTSPASLDPFYHRGGEPPSVLPACAPFSKTIGGYTFRNDGCTDSQGAYGGGYSLGAVFYKQPCPPGYQCTYPAKTLDNAVAAYASVWRTIGDSFDIQFTLDPFTPFFGPGVYTLYFYPNPDSNETLTTYSIFYAG